MSFENASPEVLAEIERLTKENAALKTARQNKLTFRVSAKSALSIYGLGRLPVTLYRSQMEALLDKADDIRAFIKANEDKLAVKKSI